MGIKVGCDEDLSGKVAIVTGSNTGIGLQTAKMLCDAGAHVVMACRSKERAKPALAEVTAGGGSAEVMALDLGDVDTIKKFAAAFLKKHNTLDVLVNNAGLNTTGGVQGPTTTKQGYEICMGTNYFGHFMLTALLMPALMVVRRARRRALLRHHVVCLQQVPLLRQGRVQDKGQLRRLQARLPRRHHRVPEATRREVPRQQRHVRRRGPGFRRVRRLAQL